MLSPVRFGTIANALRSETAARAVADQLTQQAPEKPVAVFHSGVDYATFLGDEAVMAKAMYDATQALKTTDLYSADDINRRLDNAMAGIDPTNTSDNSEVQLLEYREPRLRL